LELCRRDIDRVDATIVALLRERARLAIDAGRIKREAGQQIDAPDRERAIRARVRELATAPLDPDAAERIFRRIIDEVRAIEIEEVCR
jgi:chorismate mutase/prephenate dehydratase